MTKHSGFHCLFWSYLSVTQSGNCFPSLNNNNAIHPIPILSQMLYLYLDPAYSCCLQLYINHWSCFFYLRGGSPESQRLSCLRVYQIINLANCAHSWEPSAWWLGLYSKSQLGAYWFFLEIVSKSLYGLWRLNYDPKVKFFSTWLSHQISTTAHFLIQAPFISGISSQTWLFVTLTNKWFLNTPCLHACIQNHLVFVEHYWNTRDGPWKYSDG